MSGTIDILLTDQPLEVEAAHVWMGDVSAGGSCIFVGTVRDSTKGRQVSSSLNLKLMLQWRSLRCAR